MSALYRTIRQYVFANYSTNWSEVATWYNLVATQYPLEWAQTIMQGVERCNETVCVLQTPEELDIYAAYCSKNLSSCQFISYPQVEDGSSLISELNILIDASIITKSEAADLLPAETFAGITMLNWMSKAYLLVPCKINNDYDNDGVRNYLDTCVWTCNPNQADLDADGEGDVCDADIDADTKTNQKGVVDDMGRVSVELYATSQDNCLFVANENQEKSANPPY
ncbi:MAG: thrombospondin type 3 repeat-containing protein [Candidatus Peribacteria bacterium]|nr:MAG: thrombospondin type 3 repeat-containing protein [Candidatus Peribacteria bacterium]